MDFILNSKTKKVEIFYENASEQQAILEFMSKYLTYREDSITKSSYVYDGIGWTSVSSSSEPYTIDATNMPGTITLNGIYDKANYPNVSTSSIDMTLCSADSAIIAKTVES